MNVKASAKVVGLNEVSRDSSGPNTVEVVVRSATPYIHAVLHLPADAAHEFAFGKQVRVTVEVA